jgi:hypothetical protein
MTKHGLRFTGLRRAALLTALAMPGVAIATDSSTPTLPTPASAATANAPPEYSSDPSFGSSPGEDFTSPESEGRPGVYFFKLAAQAFEKKHYKYAIEMYRIAASWAYKPAQYNLGIMYFRGQGVPVDRPLGAAWMVLAAERGTPQYVQARDLMVSHLSDAEFAQVNVLWKQLKPTFADATALHRAEVRWAEVRSQMTGSHVGGISGPLHVGSAGGGRHAAGAPSSTPAAVLNPVATSGFEITGSHAIDGTVAYRQLRESKNPYDPRFQENPTGTATVGPLTPVKSVNGKPQAAADAPAPAASTANGAAGP